MQIQADEPDDNGDEEVLELQPEDEAPDNGEETEGEDNDEAADDEEVIISIGDEAAPASDEAPPWVRDLRKENRRLNERLAEALKGTAPQVPEVGDKPTLEGCDFDSEKFEKEFSSWTDRKAKADRAKAEADEVTTQAQQRWEAELGVYSGQSKELGVKDFTEAEEMVTASLSPVQQAIIIEGTENKALVVYALGKNPTQLQELSKITDPVKFAFAVARLEGKTKMEKRRPTSAPETSVRGSAPLTGGSDATLERLEKEAERTGDRSKIIAHKNRLREKARAKA